MMSWLLMGLALAHPLAPSVLRIEQVDGATEVHWRTPTARPTGQQSTPVLPCPVVSGPVRSRAEDGLAIETSWTLSCGPLEGTIWGVDGLELSGTDALVEVVRGEQTELALLHGPGAQFTVPAPSTRWVGADALALGARHLLTGPDHLLFVLGLVLLAPRRRLVVAITAFTVGHAASLSLASVGGLAVPAAPVEVAIAASLLWMANEVLRQGPSKLAERPWVLCLPIGLVHGLGFAGALADSGVSRGSLLPSVLGFNLGLELAQLGVVGAALLVGTLVGSRAESWRPVAGWAGGALASMWLIERVLAWAL